MRVLTIILTLISTYSYAQRTYEQLLAQRVEEIKKLPYFDNSVVVYEAGEGYGSGFPSWQLSVDYYQDDIVFDTEGKFYQALVDSKGKPPAVSPKEWQQLMSPIRPYLFLRDTAKLTDLKKLLYNEHPYIRTYAFGALARKNIDGLFDVIISNLGDTTRIDQMTGDFAFPVCPVELMIMYLRDDLTEDQIQRLKLLIRSDYKHLEYAEKILDDE